MIKIKFNDEFGRKNKKRNNKKNKNRRKNKIIVKDNENIINDKSEIKYKYKLENSIINLPNELLHRIILNSYIDNTIVDNYKFKVVFPTMEPEYEKKSISKCFHVYSIILKLNSILYNIFSNYELKYKYINYFIIKKIYVSDNINCYFIAYYFMGKCHRFPINGPSCIICSERKYFIHRYYNYGIKHRRLHPFEIKYKYLLDDINDDSFVINQCLVVKNIDEENILNYKLKHKAHFYKGLRHNFNKYEPTNITYRKNGRIKGKSYYNYGNLNSPNRKIPALITFYKNGHAEELYFYKENKIHRDSNYGPAIMGWYENGKLNYKKYLEYYEYHRQNNKKEEPSIINYHENGKVKSLHYKNDGESHRINGPSLIKFNRFGNIIYKEYMRNNSYYRKYNYKMYEKVAPTRIWYYDDGQIEKECYHLDGKLKNTIKYERYNNNYFIIEDE